MTERELVRCGCGVVRNDDDPLLQLTVQIMAEATRAADWGRVFEHPRVCRGCGAVYMLPRQQAPAEHDTERPPP